MAGSLEPEKKRKLAGVLSKLKLRYTEIVRNEVECVLGQFPDLQAESGHYDTSRHWNEEEKLLVLSGTIPVNYKGTVYNIPIAVYLLDVHPYHAPMCFVRPTPDMVIKSSQYVDTSGRIYMPYLNQWAHPHSDVLGLLQLLIMTFSDSMPVFSRGSVPSRPPPPQPYGASYPAGGSGFRPMPQPPQAPTNSSPYNGSYAACSNLPYPNRPAPAPPSSSGPPAGYTPYPSTYPNQGYPSYAGSSAGYPVQTPEVRPGSGPGNYSTVTEEHIHASLVSAVEDKLRRKLHESIGRANAELQVVRNTKEDLERGEKKLQSILERLSQAQSELNVAVVSYTKKKDELTKILESIPKDDLKIDDAVDTTAPLYRQLLRCYMEDNAKDDAMYYLSKALRGGVIELDAYLKHVRNLSREQYMLRATMLKCRKVAGLD